MILAIYYHIPIYKDLEGIRTASYFGLFLDKLAQQVEKLVCFMHQCDERQFAEMDYELQEKNIEWVNLGPKSHILIRYFFQDRIIAKHKKQLQACDAVLVRVPSPIFSAFEKYHHNVWFFVVGSYGEAAPYVQGNILKKVVLRWLFKRIDKLLIRSFRNQHVFVNSQVLWNKLEGKTKTLSIIKTTTITSDSFYSKEVLAGDTIRLLYTGRIDFAKGLMELSDAVNMLLIDGMKVSLTIVGWEEGVDKSVSKAILKRFERDGNQDKVRFVPRQPAGEKLNQYYREADIYVIPSYHEGFPRTIWEAMSQSTLVVASTVGSIPYYISDKEAYLIPPKNSQALCEALKEAFENPAKAKEKVQSAIILVAEITLDIQTKKLVEIIKIRLSNKAKMKILGVNFSHDSALTLIEDGAIIFSIEEEKTSRVKQEFGWPKTAWAKLSEQFGLKPEDIDVIAFGSKFYSSISKNEIKYRFSKNRADRNMEILNRLTTYIGLTTNRISEANKDVFHRKLKKLGFTKAKVVFKEHHLSHAASSYYTAPFQTDLVITCDGHGDGDSFMFYKPGINGLELIHGINYESSVGQFYSCITQLLGFRPTRHEGKITGLAAFGEDGKLVDAFRNLFFKKGQDLRRFPYGQRVEKAKEYKVESQLSLREKINLTNSESEIGYLYGLNGRILLEHLKRITAGHSKEDIAYACQLVAEEIVIQEFNAIFQRFFEPGEKLKLSLAGGVFANVRINQKIYELDWVDNIFIQPAMGDSGLALGGAILADLKFNGRDLMTRQYAFENTYIGPDYTGEIKATLDNLDSTKFVVTLMENPAKTIAELLYDNKVVGFWQGNMEWGPRALGMRSMILNTFDKSVNDSVNKRLSRTEFMPFAPSIIDYKIKEYIPSYNEDCPAADYMTITYDVAKEYHDMLQAVVHVDGTARPQVVRKESNPYYYAIIDEFYKISGCGAIVNTSFNAHEEPIVSTPAVATKALFEDRIDVLVLENYLVTQVR